MKFSGGAYAVRGGGREKKEKKLQMEANNRHTAPNASALGVPALHGPFSHPMRSQWPQNASNGPFSGPSNAASFSAMAGH